MGDDADKVIKVLEKAKDPLTELMAHADLMSAKLGIDTEPAKYIHARFAIWGAYERGLSYAMQAAADVAATKRDANVQAACDEIRERLRIHIKANGP